MQPVLQTSSQSLLEKKFYCLRKKSSIFSIFEFELFFVFFEFVEQCSKKIKKSRARASGEQQILNFSFASEQRACSPLARSRLTRHFFRNPKRPHSGHLIVHKKGSFRFRHRKSIITYRFFHDF